MGGKVPRSTGRWEWWGGHRATFWGVSGEEGGQVSSGERMGQSSLSLLPQAWCSGGPQGPHARPDHRASARVPSPAGAAFTPHARPNTRYPYGFSACGTASSRSCPWLRPLLPLQSPSSQRRPPPASCFHFCPLVVSPPKNPSSSVTQLHTPQGFPRHIEEAPTAASRPLPPSSPTYHSLPTSYTGCLVTPLSFPSTECTAASGPLHVLLLPLPLSPSFLHSGSSGSSGTLLQCHILRPASLGCCAPPLPPSITQPRLAFPPSTSTRHNTYSSGLSLSSSWSSSWSS